MANEGGLVALNALHWLRSGENSQSCYCRLSLLLKITLPAIFEG